MLDSYRRLPRPLFQPREKQREEPEAVPMKVAIDLGPPDDDWDLRVSYALEAERLGVEMVWTAEAWGYDAATPLAFLAAKTSRIRLGTGIMQIGARTPAMTAMTALTLAALSDGRFLLGLGVSGPQVMEGWHGVPFDHPLERTREFVEMVRMITRGERLIYDGEIYRVPLPGGEGKALIPGAKPRPNLPIYLASLGPRNLELTGALADGWLGTSFIPEQARVFFDPLERGARDAGRSLAAGTPDQIVAAMPGSVRVTSGRPEGSAGAMAWRRGAHWRVWCPPGTSYPGAAVNPDLQDAVTVAALAGELAAQADRLDAATDVGTPAGAIAPASAWRRREGARERPPRPKSSLVDALAPHQSAPPGAEVGAPAAADSGAAPGADVGVMPPRSSARWPLAGTERVTCRFGQLTAVRDVSIQIWPGEIVGLIGANGAGKTTLIRMLLGLVPATSGQVVLLGEPPSRRTRSRIGYVPQGLGLYADLTAEENMEFAATVFGSDDSQLPAEVRDRPGIPVGQLPLGLQRRVAFAQALAHDPELLILDEPTSGVDPLGRARLWQTIAAAVRAGAGALVSTHYMEEAGECDRLIIMADGAVVAAGTAAQIIGAEQVTVVESASWADSFSRLERAGLPVALAGRTLRIPGVSLAEVQRVLGGSQAAPDGAGNHGTHGGRVPTELPAGCRIYQAAATLEERFFELASAAPQVTPVPA